MKYAKSFVIASIIVSGILFTLVGCVTNNDGIIMSGTSLTGAFVVLLLTFVTVVPEHEVWVVIDDARKQFSRTLSPGPHLLSPFEVVDDTINTMPTGVSGIAKAVKSADGVPHRVSFSVTVQVEPDKVSAEIRPTIIRMLPKLVGPIVRGRVDEVVRNIFGQYSALNLSNGTLPARVKAEFQAALREALAPFGINVFRAVLGAIEPPASYQASVLAAQGQRLDDAASRDALAQLNTILQDMSPQAQLLFADLLKLREVSQNGNAVVYTPTGDGAPQETIDPLIMVERLRAQRSADDDNRPTA